MGRVSFFFQWYLLSLDFLVLISLVFFFNLPREKRANSYYWGPFFILMFCTFYENCGAYLNYNNQLNEMINGLLGNFENPKYTVWFYNIFNLNLLTIMLLFLIKSYLPISKKKLINWLMGLFMIASIIIQITGIEPIYGSQALIFAIGACALITSCGIYFTNFIKDDSFLEVNPLKLASFWQLTFILFYHAIIFLKTVAEQYLWSELYSFGKSLEHINTVFWLFVMVAMILPYAAPTLKLNLEKEPYNV